MDLSTQDIEAIEHATLAAVPPARLEQVPGWLLGLDTGTVGRAHSAVPLRHDAAPDLQLLPQIEALYAAQRLRPVLRLPLVPAFDAMRAAIAGQYTDVSSPVLTQVSTPQAMLQLPADVKDGGWAALARTPEADWAAVFLGEGFDAVDGASRVAILGRARDAVFASVRVEGQVAAVGSACFSHGWMGVHGMRTAPGFRGRGLASAILRSFAQEAQARGIAKAFLQVEEVNTGAQSLYRRAGFATAWRYSYFRKA